MDSNVRLNAMAQWMWDARRRRQPYANLPEGLRPGSIAEAYAAQEAYYRLGRAGLRRGRRAPRSPPPPR